MAKNGDSKSPGNSGGTLGYDAQLWAATDKMRAHMDALEYKHVALLPKLLSGELRVPATAGKLAEKVG